MKFTTTFLMALSLGMLSLGCGDGTESAVDPAGPDPALMGPSTDGDAVSGSTDEANDPDEGGDAAPEGGDAKPEGGDAKPEGGDAKPEGDDAKPEGDDAKPAPAPEPEKKG